MPAEDDGPSARHTFTPVAAGKLATVVTHLEMLERPSPRVGRTDTMLRVEHVAAPDPGWYRHLYRVIGENWLWYSRLAMSDTELNAIIRHPAVEIHRLLRGDADAGLLELDFRGWPDVELSFFGLVPDAVGSGAGGVLMDAALDRAWRDGPRRFWVHTCTLDHPRALGFYEHVGFRAYLREVEIDDDPRMTGVLPRTAAAWYPIIE